MVAVLAFAPGIARAQDADPDPGPVQAMLDCGVAGKALSPLKANVIAGHVQCALELDGFSLEGLSAEAWIDDGAHRAGTAAPGAGDDPDRFVFDPFVRGTDFGGCKDFVLHAQLLLDGEVTWSTDLPVKTKCKKPKKIAAKLSCSFAARDGSVYAWPGNGAKKKPELDDTLACWLTIAKKGDTLTATIGGHAEPMWKDDDTGAWSSGEMLEEGDDFTACEAFAVVASIANADGQVVYAGKLAIAQTCSR